MTSELPLSFKVYKTYSALLTVCILTALAYSTQRTELLVDRANIDISPGS